MVPTRIHTIVVPLPLTFDSALAILFLRQQGGELFPNIGKAKLAAWSDEFEGKTAEELETQGWLCVNCGRGAFDHHPHEDFPGECAFTRVLSALGKRDSFLVRELANFAVWDDTRTDDVEAGVIPTAEQGPFTLARVVKDWYIPPATDDLDYNNRVMVEAAEAAIKHLTLPISHYLIRQDRFRTEAQAAYDSGAQKVVTVGSKSFRIVAAETDCDLFGAYVRWRHKKELVIVVRQHNVPDLKRNTVRRHMQISCSSRVTVPMEPLAQAVNLAEDHQLSSVRTEENTETPRRWHFIQKKGRHGSSMLLAGSRSYRHVPGTTLSLLTVTDLVEEWLIGYGWMDSSARQ